MLIDNLYLTKNSIRFILELIKKNHNDMTFNQFHYNNLEADLYSQNNTRKNQGVVVIFHGLNQQGNKDSRLLSLVNSLTNIGFNCLLPQLNAYTEIRLPSEEEFDDLVVFMEYLFNNKIESNNRILFLGPSVSCLFMAKIASKTKLKNEIKSLCLISPYFSAEDSFKEILESPKNFYAQLVTLKLLLHSKYLQDNNEKSIIDMQILNKAINLCFLKKSEPEIKNKIIDFVADNSSKNGILPDYINRLGRSGFITKDIEPFFQEMTQKAYYSESIIKINAKITLIHSLNDTIFSPVNSIQLAEHLRKNNIKCHMLITSLLEHADISLKKIIREFPRVIKSLNYFLA
ncbi:MULTISPECIES: hypothetical protein [unclassified Legionella]|uniref:hypothetical protein n=1 Tax=unclassified Legionella TaxID=2622702 RepID=UPI001054FEB1|nr:MULTISPECIES: hypothetical protein [unclassified Legionella]MDI9818569.1 hypothetical protein [Legionella sp. PL877]